MASEPEAVPLPVASCHQASMLLAAAAQQSSLSP